MLKANGLIQIEDGQTVKSPGVFEMSMDWYHEDNCAGPSISSSGIRQIENECPAEYWAFSYLNPLAYPGKDKNHFGFGRAAHCLLLGDEAFKGNYAIRPSKWKDWKTKDSREWREMSTADGLTVITHEDMKKISDMGREMRNHPLVTGSSLLDGVMEATIIWEDRETGIWLKTRPDVVPEFEGAITDYKSAASARPAACRKAIENYGYHIQMALCGMGFKEVLDRDVQNFLLFFQQSVVPHHITPVEVSEDSIYWGKCQIRRALRTFAKCLDAGHWPGYTEEIPVFDLSPHVRERLVEQQEAGLLPNVGGEDAEST